MHALLEGAIPHREVSSLGADLVVQLLEAQHRFYARDQRHLVNGLGEIFVRSRLEAGDHVLTCGLRRHQDDRHERHIGIGFDPAGHLDAVELRHHHVQQDEVGELFLGGRQCLLPVGSLG